MQIVINNNNMSLNAEQKSFVQHKKLRPEDRQSLKSRMEYINFILANKSSGSGQEEEIGMGHLLNNKSELMRESNKIKHQLDYDDSLIERQDLQRHRLVLRMKELEDKITKNFPSWRSQWTTVKTSGNLNFEKSVNESIYFMTNFTKDVEEWKKIKNILEPDDPEADNVYMLSKQGPTHED